MSQTFNDVQIIGTADVVQLSVQANATQTSPIQLWQDSGSNPLARITGDGRFQIGNNIVFGATDALIQANYNPSGTTMPTSVWHAPGVLNVGGTLAGTVNWVFHELQLAGTPTVNGVQNALYSKLTNSTTGNAGSADLRAATLQTISSGGGTATPVGKATGVRAIASNAASSYLSQAVGVEATISNDTGGSISTATAFNVAAPSNNGTIGTLYGIQVAGLTQGSANYALLTRQGVVSFGDKVGLGTTSPGVPFDVSTALSPGMRLTSSSSSISPAIEIKDAAATPNRWWLASGLVTATDGKFSIYDARQVVSRLTIDTSGNVGIGTTSPQAPLDVNGQVRLGGASAISAYDSLLVGQRPNGASASIRLAPVSNTARGWKLDAYDDGTNTSFQIYDQTAGTARLYISNPSGNVGIGTSFPAQMLHVAGSNPLVQIDNSTSGFQGLKLAALGWQVGFGTNKAAGYWYDFSHDLGTTHELYFNGTNWIFPTGSVGLGTNSPQALLHVNGKGYVETGLATFSAAGNGQVAALGGTIFDHFADVGNSGTTETDLYSDTIPASALNSNGDCLIAYYSGVSNSSTASQSWRFYFGGTLFGYINTTPSSAGGRWFAQVIVVRESSSVVRCALHFVLGSSGATTNAATTYTDYGRVTGLTLTNSQILKITGQSTGATNDVVAKLGKVSWQSAA